MECCLTTRARRSSNVCCAGRRCRSRPDSQIAIKLTKAVAALHRAGIIHRDIKPENIMLETDGGLKLIDLGVARLRQFDEGESLEVPGTRSYMAPELFAGTPADESADIFALGVTIYRMFTGGAYPYGEVEAFSSRGSARRRALAQSSGPICRPGSIAASRAPSPSIAASGMRTRSSSASSSNMARCAPFRTPSNGRRFMTGNPMRFWQLVSRFVVRRAAGGARASRLSPRGKSAPH